MSTDAPKSEPCGDVLRAETLVYGGDCLARRTDGRMVPVPFVLPGESLALSPSANDLPSATVRVLAASPDRGAPACAHFGVCGGCQYQMAAYPAQVLGKAGILRELFDRAGLADLPSLQTLASPEPYGYRNRIRLRVEGRDGRFALGYNLRGSREFLPVGMCPIAAPVLWRMAETLLAVASRHAPGARWLAAAGEVELFCTADESRLQLTLLCGGKPLPDAAGFARFAEAISLQSPALRGAGAVRVDPRSGRALETVAQWGAPGLPYTVGGETYWVTRGGFFQVNRFLLPALVNLVCGDLSGKLAWDLFAGGGLFSRVLVRQFGAVTAVEANPGSGDDLRAAFAKLGPQYRAVEARTVDFLREAALQRERPALIVLDPPRAGAGAEVCALLGRIAPPRMVYLSCDPTTLAQDLALLTQSGYRVAALHLIDLFPQTYHMETLAILERVD